MNPATKVWGTICDDGFDDFDAKVVCRQLGFLEGIAFPKAKFGAGKGGRGTIYLDDLKCSGKEKNIGACKRGKPFGKHNCGHQEDASVRCGKL